MEHRRNILNKSTSAMYGKLLDYANRNNIPDYINHLTFSVLELCPIDMLTERENYYINELESQLRGMNTVKSNRRGDDVIREEGNIELISTLKDSNISRIQLNIDITTAEINKGNIVFRKSSTKKATKFKKGDFAFSDKNLENSELFLDNEYDIILDNEKIDIYNIPKESLDALIEIGKKQS